MTELLAEIRQRLDDIGLRASVEPFEDPTTPHILVHVQDRYRWDTQRDGIRATILGASSATWPKIVVAGPAAGDRVRDLLKSGDFLEAATEHGD